MINRKEIVRNHAVKNHKFDIYSPLSVGNGEFAFTCDATGLQTFGKLYEDSMPVCTMAQWGWHTAPFSQKDYDFSPKNLVPKMVFNGERDVPYLINPGDTPEGFNWLRENPHKFSLANIGFLFPGKGEGDQKYDIAGEADKISEINQKLCMYKGEISSSFKWNGSEVSVKTCVHPRADALAVRVKSPLLGLGLRINLRFPAPDIRLATADFEKMDDYDSKLLLNSGGRAEILRLMDRDRYFVSVSHSGSLERMGKNSFVISASGDTLEAVFAFSPMPLRETPSAKQCFFASSEFWANYWEEGGFVSIKNGGKKGKELQRRIILSQYLTAIQCAGSLPPAETGLTANSWYGKFHLEMHWWHSVHFPFWKKGALLERSMWYYHSILPKAKELAASQGYKGARWPKMTDISGNDAPSAIGSVLIWQQPHPIYYALAIYRENPCEEVLRRYEDIVMESAEFMADFLRWDEEGQRYVLGPGLIPAQENHKPADVLNPTFELEYWLFGLKAANEWRKKLGLEENADWAEKAEKIARPTVKDGLYIAHEKCPDTFEPPYNRDHPSMTCAFGVMPGDLIDKDAMLNTFRAIVSGGKWQIEEHVWGWDFPVLAMTAARLGLGDEAVDALLFPSEKNVYLKNGHNKQSDRKDLPLYLPGNGGLLTAVALMCAGWDGSEGKNPGFPKDWDVEWEDILPLP
ncbi:MAG: glycoside hydrolase family 65 [Christensenellales bacterium]|jgi:hypothetical protein